MGRTPPCCLSVTLLWVCATHNASCSAPQQNNHANVSGLLNSLLQGYDSNLRPDFGGPPTVVEVDIQLKSMGPISETDLTYSMNCFFRQSWVDRRLAFDGVGLDVLSLSVSTLERIWRPDTFFFNGRRSQLHKITTPNKFVRLYGTGRVLYSSRMTIQASCPMSLHDFPMDTQHCPLLFGSFGYFESDVMYRWTRNREKVEISQDMKLSQFDLVRTPVGQRTERSHRGNFSTLWASFHLRRHMGNFMIQVYGPCVLLVVLSWVSFWLNREATSDRISLGVTTVLTMTFLGLEARTDLPKVPYSTALDLFLWISYGFIFASIIQFAFVHFFTKYGYGEVYFPPPDSDPGDSSESDPASAESATPRHQGITDSAAPRHQVTPNTAAPHKSVAVRQVWNNGPPRNGNFNSVSLIDRGSRLLFPAAFLAANVAYWYSYLSRSEHIRLVHGV
ncbi:gamma-aminobutyric acid receptor alpha-like [Pollicipes pollicipes]|uniref:gamma-aminobutyric acid receptor alpha-like n=1 Tax=Pollicipes pollicipes TaxID=41117 RepID=UPI0018850CEC|nr:gamma-aminobutyric acid receptor alpha-like [Pollicipes pollicipes]